MKWIWIQLLCCLTVAAKAQTVSISVNGNRNEQVIVNDVTYKIDNDAVNNISKNITLTNLRPGEYSLQLIRINDNYINDDKVPVKDNNVMRTRTISTFTVRPGYDVAIVIAANGIVQVKDKQIVGTTSDPLISMTDVAFNSLLSDIEYNWRNTRRITAAQTALTNNNNYFTTQQALRIIQTVDGESNRVALAKLAYSRLTDPGNFVQIYNIMSTAESRNDLVGFIRQSGGNMLFSYSENFRQEMSQQNFDAVFRKVKLTIDAGLRANAVTEIISNTTNYFTVDQVYRLLETVNSETIRLQSLKTVYTHITDPFNFPVLYNLLTIDNSKIELINYVSTAGENGGLVNYNLNKPAISEKEFTSIYANAKQQAVHGALIQYLTNTFSDFANYFTSSQAALLINLTDGELTRLGLAKTAYRGIIDPENYLQLMNQLLTSPVTKNELSIYAYSYRSL